MHSPVREAPLSQGYQTLDSLGDHRVSTFEGAAAYEDYQHSEILYPLMLKAGSNIDFERVVLYREDCRLIPSTNTRLG